MKKVFLMLAVVAAVFIACDKDKDNDDNLAEIIIGSWMNVEENGKPMLTDRYVVFNFVSATKAYMSAAQIPPQGYEQYGELWVNRLELDGSIDGKKILLSNKIDDQTTGEVEIDVISFNSNEIEAKIISRNIKNGEIINSVETNDRLKRVNADYRESIIGMWEGRCTSVGGSAYDDGKTHRWEYKPDGTYCYYYNDEGEWKLSVALHSKYFVAGQLLCTGWQNEGDESHIENWEIVSIKDNVMKWKALRNDEDGGNYEVTFEMSKVPEE